MSAVRRNTTSPGERRANAVKMYLQGKGVSADQISIVSYGKKNQQYWVMTKRHMPKTVAPYWFTKRMHEQ